MKFNKLIVAIFLTAGFSSAASAADQGSGKVTFTGSIIDAPCSVVSGSADQTVELGQVSNALLKTAGATSTPKDFSIKLEHCDFGSPAKKNSVQVTFTGQEAPGTSNKLLAINGTASGAGVGIKNGLGEEVTLGTAVTAQKLNDGNNELRFQGYLQGLPKKDVNGTPTPVEVVPGNFTAVANFKLAYN
ncbi:fimbria A protein (plasmid) [Klebsiella oxytoca]|uniref:fimbrial protein n=1 Tax=Klebsiella oxytoca TaxID=571 RepID=UPI000D52927D|nr:fimbrial protein [Klebsiella oxytoca]AWF33365.1 fimbria A protein [Klebsiella oxytoca]